MGVEISTVGGSLRDVQSLVRHSSLQMTQKYIKLNHLFHVEVSVIYWSNYK